ncbi:hypothetical protein [Piscinibacter sp. HJYY11]|uniref:hypothetical protein n=1 Tax=Piscinibacter sp. HJYY11 TaxID=2801333 RepID=UPI00191CC64C|nr:hypothetical protein [Piscinibacter sp. HJYY11]MBL0726232.1 hypothetical protein [Piscinibacter sp. HJYY11]
MTRALHLSLLAPCLLASHLSAAQPASADTRKPASPCEAHQPRHDRLDVRCRWPAGSGPQALRFDAHFAGSHDDTSASLVASLNGTALNCAAGSKTQLDGQDEGDVTMSCRFSLTSPLREEVVLRFELAWFHARQTGFELVSE